jgi:hypothetical protein
MLNNNKWFIQIADKGWDQDLLLRESDSDVYKSWKNCYKHYFWLNQKTIKQYHVIQNIGSKQPINIDLQNSWNLITRINSDKFDWYNGVQITNIEFITLDIWNKVTSASNISTHENITISEIDYIEWKTLFDLCYQNNNDFDFQMNIYNILEKLNSVYDWNMTSKNPMDKFQIHWINCKITDLKNWTLFITITDLARNIWEFVENNKSRIQSIMQ